MSPHVYEWDGALVVLDADAVKRSEGPWLSACQGFSTRRLSGIPNSGWAEDPEDCLFMWNPGKEETLRRWSVVDSGVWIFNRKQKCLTEVKTPTFSAHKHTHVFKYENSEGSSGVGGGGVSEFAWLSVIWALILHNGNKDYGPHVAFLNDLLFSSLVGSFKRNLLRVVLKHYGERQTYCHNLTVCVQTRHLWLEHLNDQNAAASALYTRHLVLSAWQLTHLHPLESLGVSCKVWR